MNELLEGWVTSRDTSPMTEIGGAERDPQYRLAMLTLLLMGAQWRREVALKEHYARMDRLKAKGGYETWLKAKMERNKRYPKKPRPPAPPKPKKVTLAERLKTEPEFAKAYYARKRAMAKERREKMRIGDPEVWAAKTEADKQKSREYFAAYEKKHRERLNAMAKERYHERMSDPVEGEANREKHRTKVYRANRKLAASGHLNKYMREKRAVDINFRIADNLRRRVNNVLRGNSKSAHTLELIGCTIPELRAHLESKFQPGMSWANYGNGYGFWNVDHIKPCTAYDLSSEAQQWECFHWKNLQPMWYEDNISKGDRIPLSPCPPPPPA